MKNTMLNMIKYLIVMTAFISSSTLQAQDVIYNKVPADPARVPVPEGQRGEVIQRRFSASSIYPGTQRDYKIYVPKAYTPDKPACLFVGLDAIMYDAPTVFDNLIPKGDMPVTIGVFVNGGRMCNAKNEVIHNTRQYETDTMDDTFVRFLTEELLPDVEKQSTSDGRSIRLSQDGNDRSIAGASSGGLCAFNAAWQRPDLFSRVFSCVGSFVGLHGGHEFHILVRKTEPKPIRVFLEAGTLDQALPPVGNIYEANVLMESALRYAGYEMDYTWSVSGHGVVHATQIFPDVMRWLWKGYPNKVQCGPSENQMLKAILDSESVWMPCELSVTPQSDLLSNTQGDVFFSDSEGTVYCLEKGQTQKSLFQLSSSEKLLACSGQKLYTADAEGNIVVYEDKKKRILSTNLAGTEGILVSAKEKVYVAQRLPGGERAIWLLDAEGNKTLQDKLLHGGVQLAFSPDQQLLTCTEEHSCWVYVYTVDENGMLSNGCRYYWLHNTDNYDFDRKGNMAFDVNKVLYVATPIGIQVSETRGLALAILTLPSGGKISSICFGGENKDVLFALSGSGKLYSRKMKVKGI